MDQSNRGMKVPKRILNNLLLSLGSGVVPRSGAPYIAIGRQAELGALTESLHTAEEGGASVRFLVGRYGSGKSFLVQLVRGYALDRGFLTVDADLSPERRLVGSSGSGLATYRELVRNMASAAAPDGGALPLVLVRYYDQVRAALAKEGAFPDSASYHAMLSRRIYDNLSSLCDGVGGFDLATVLVAYFEALSRGEEGDERRAACLRYLRGEYATRAEARRMTGLSLGSIIDDDSWYDALKLLAALAVRLGYRGLAVFIDECVNLYKIPHRIARESNYEKILSIFNDALQGRASHMSVIFCGTPQFLEDHRRGLFSYEALRSRLADGSFDNLGYVNLSSPVIRLRRLSDNEMLALLVRLTALHEQQSGTPPRVTGAQMERFLTESLSRAGAEEMMTPRELIRDYLGILNILRDHADADFDALLAKRSRSWEGETEGAPVANAPQDTRVPNAPDDGTPPLKKNTFTLSDIEL